MATRAWIGRRTKFGFSGVYHHWDGYPSALGKALVELYQTKFGDVKKNA